MFTIFRWKTIVIRQSLIILFLDSNTHNHTCAKKLSESQNLKNRMSDMVRGHKTKQRETLEMYLHPMYFFLFFFLQTMTRQGESKIGKRSTAVAAVVMIFYGEARKANCRPNTRMP